MQTFPHPLKALFLDLDETLCDTSGANQKALAIMASDAKSKIPGLDGDKFAHLYLKGIYRELGEPYTNLLQQSETEEAFRHALIQQILTELGFDHEHNSLEMAQYLQASFDDSRSQHFDFFNGITDWLARMRKKYTLVVITNGPTYSQIPKVERVNLKEHVDHILIGGQEPEQKPHKSIFEKALKLANCQNNEVIHIGDSLSADIQGAINSNIHSVWVQHGQTPDPEIQADWVIEHPFDLESLLETIISA